MAEVNNTNTVTLKKKSQFKDFVRRFRKNKGAIVGLFIIIVLLICALFPAQLVGPDYKTQDPSNRYQHPNAEHIFGTDELGRDVLVRMVWGARTSLEISLSAVAFSCVFGTIIGCLAGFYGGHTDNILMRLMDILMAIPSTLLGISIVAAFGSSIFVLIAAMGISSIAGFSRICRSAVITIRDQEYIEAARATGASDFRIITKYVLPNALAPIIVQVSMSIAASILSISGLSFIGLGVPAPTPEWGSMLSNGRTVIRDHAYILIFPGAAIMLAVFAFNLLGDGLRDALDPRLKS
ncbi:MAG: ABC transporter permease [Firmicutes bacterium]|nr:ABC transporter permease [Bacillota bacterium]